MDESKVRRMDEVITKAQRAMSYLGSPSDIRRSGITEENAQAMVAIFTELAELAQMRLADFVREDGTFVFKK